MIANQLIFEPLAGKQWMAVGCLGHSYTVADSGLWDSDPDNSGPNEEQRVASQALEEERVREIIHPAALAKLLNEELLLDLVRRRTDASVMTDEEKHWPGVAILAGHMEVIEIVVALAAKKVGSPMNWGYVGGRAVVHCEADRAKCRAALAQSIPQTDIQKEEHYA